MSIGSYAVKGVFWSLVQNWGSKFFTFVIFVVLARFLTPAQYGVASAAYAVILLVGLISELGFADAVVQRRDLEPRDINLPFFISLGVSSLGAIASIVFSKDLEALLNVRGLAIVITGSAGLAPLTTISLFQEMNYRRSLRFRDLALRMLLANLASGVIAIGCAYCGLGVWSLVVQSYLTLVIGMSWLWFRPIWRPTFEIRLDTFRELGRFGMSVATMRLMDFAAVRLVDVLIVHRFGIAVLGVYAVGSRLYQVLMQLLQSALNDVSLTILSKISHDRDRMAAIYTQAVTIASYAASPIFVGAASVSFELCTVLFGTKWAGVDKVSMPLLMLGAIQCVQYLNGAYLSARGRPFLVLLSASVKYTGMFIGLLFIPSRNASDVVLAFALLQLLATPLSFYLVTKELGIRLRQLGLTLFPAVLANCAGFALVTVLRQIALAKDLPPVLAGLVYLTAFSLAYVLVVITFGRKEVKGIIAFAVALKKPRPSVPIETASATK